MKVQTLAMTLAIAAAGPLGAQEIVLYQGENFSGPRYSANSSVSDLARVGFNDRASSVTIRGGSWQLCSDSYYNGQCVTLGPGNYSSLRTMGLNNSVSSLREIGWHGGGGGGGGGGDRRRLDRAVFVAGHDGAVVHVERSRREFRRNADSTTARRRR